jgi:hypothetical protein
MLAITLIRFPICILVRNILILQRPLATVTLTRSTLVVWSILEIFLDVSNEPIESYIERNVIVPTVVAVENFKTHVEAIQNTAKKSPIPRFHRLPIALLCTSIWGHHHDPLPKEKLDENLLVQASTMQSASTVDHWEEFANPRECEVGIVGCGVGNLRTTTRVYARPLEVRRVAKSDFLRLIRDSSHLKPVRLCGRVVDERAMIVNSVEVTAGPPIGQDEE